jgi:hypothetical protein
MKKGFWLLFVLGVLFGFVLAKSTGSIERADVKAAQKLFHLDFNDSEIDSMISYLEDNLKGYDSMRAYFLGQ